MRKKRVGSEVPPVWDPRFVIVRKGEWTWVVQRRRYSGKMSGNKLSLLPLGRYPGPLVRRQESAHVLGSEYGLLGAGSMELGRMGQISSTGEK